MELHRSLLWSRLSWRMWRDVVVGSASIVETRLDPRGSTVEEGE